MIDGSKRANPKRNRAANNRTTLSPLPPEVSPESPPPPAPPPAAPASSRLGFLVFAVRVRAKDQGLRVVRVRAKGRLRGVLVPAQWRKRSMGYDGARR